MQNEIIVQYEETLQKERKLYAIMHQQLLEEFTSNISLKKQDIKGYRQTLLDSLPLTYVIAEIPIPKNYIIEKDSGLYAKQILSKESSIVRDISLQLLDETATTLLQVTIIQYLIEPCTVSTCPTNYSFTCQFPTKMVQRVNYKIQLGQDTCFEFEYIIPESQLIQFIQKEYYDELAKIDVKKRINGTFEEQYQQNNYISHLIKKDILPATITDSLLQETITHFLYPESNIQVILKIVHEKKDYQNISYQIRNILTLEGSHIPLKRYSLEFYFLIPIDEEINFKTQPFFKADYFSLSEPIDLADAIFKNRIVLQHNTKTEK